MTRLALVVATVLVVGSALSLVVFSLPEFGSAAAPTRNEAVRAYIEDSLEQTGAPSSITAIVFDYRGYDTFGEATVLFTAGAAAAAVLVRSRRG